MKKFRVKMAFSTYRKGDVISPAGLHRDYLINYGFIEPEPDAVAVAEPEPERYDAPVIEAVIEVPEVETATAPRRKRGRPRRG